MAMVPQPLLILLFFLSLLSIVNSSPSQHIQIVDAERRIDLTSHIIKVYLTLKDSVWIIFPSSMCRRDVYKRHRVESFTVVDLSLIHLWGSIQVTARSSLVHAGAQHKGVFSRVESFTVVDLSLIHLWGSIQVTARSSLVHAGAQHKGVFSRVESFTVVDPTKRAGTELKYGPYENHPPYSYSPVLVHFENNNPFAVVEELEREIEISHWGSIQVTERYSLVHAGAQHKGVFSRVEYQTRPAGTGVSSFKHLLAKLPPRVHSVYYRDGIGNISSSHLRTDSRKSELEIEPRYPLFGGWKATFVIGYGLPLQDFLFESPDGRRYLNFTFGCPLVETVVDKLIVKVVLPEGSKDPTAEIPFEVKQHLEIKYSYLDVVGRTVVVLEKRNVVPEHNIRLQVYYGFNPIFMLAEPLMLVSAFFLLFVASVAYLHIDLSIRK
ncbi:oligosaccharyltransferase complex subunit alpha [Vigna unguiculata]|uniref:Dolichyl-diphosphooligosaccharide--protein glycosyltransferase subunit 1 n=1 Tax=Vigna unguiculata TaxID=3917 RepID=A0A4D6N7K1_VIGUN|nr:oligosaccharyltransferase complex subunit alpha [Vigna unguiculata]